MTKEDRKENRRKLIIKGYNEALSLIYEALLEGQKCAVNGINTDDSSPIVVDSNDNPRIWEAWGSLQCYKHLVRITDEAVRGYGKN